MMAKPILTLNNIHRSFSSSGRTVKAVNGVSLSLGRGETLGVVGESGSGKSTLGRIAVGLDRPDEGAVVIDGTDVTCLAGPQRREMFRASQMVFQDPSSSLNPRLAVGRQIGEGLFASGVSDWNGIRERVSELFGKVGLQQGHVDRYPHEVSGGQRQRIAIARALAPGPTVLVADEPVSALDVTIQAQILDLLADLQEQEFLSYLFISHDIAVVAHLSQRIVVMHRGRVVEFGLTAEIIHNPQHPYTKGLLDAIPRLGRRRDGGGHSTCAMPDHTDEDTIVMVSADHGLLSF